MDPQLAFQLCFDFLGSKPILVEPSATQVTSDAGLLPSRELDEQIGLTRQFADDSTIEPPAKSSPNECAAIDS